MVNCKQTNEKEILDKLREKYRGHFSFKLNHNKQLTHVLFWDLENLNKIPEEIASFKFIEGIHINNCSLKEFNDDFFEAENIKVIDISDNPIEQLDVSFEDYTSLISLNINNTNLKELPDELLKNKGLEELRFFNTKINEIPEEIFSIDSLKRLHLNYSKDIPIKLDKLKKLIMFGGKFDSLSNVQLLKNMQILIFDDSDFSVVPDTLDNFNDILFLSFRNCKNLKTLPSSIFKSLEEQQLDLDLVGCDNFKSLPKSLINSNQIGSITLDRCPNFNYFPPGMYINSIRVIDANWKNLPKNFFKTDCHDLWIDGHEFHSINGIKNMKSLGFCVIINGNIEVVPKGIMELPELHHINLENNKIRKYPQFVQRQKQFDIALGGNPIEE
ncbi:leucine-rich repeat domain-containing protein [Flammeovirga pacifica]|nr:leucine-rich repeat protein [Flammeovirga pacifica]